MNHQPFRGWLLSDGRLTPEQRQALQEHLQSCDSCNQINASWAELELVIKKTPLVGPTPGFTRRWQANLEDYQAHLQARKGWLTIGATAVLVTTLVVLLIWQVWSVIQAPGSFVASLFDRMVGLVYIYYLMQDIFSSIQGTLPIYTFFGMFFLVGIISFMSVLWLAAYRKLSLARRAV